MAALKTKFDIGFTWPTKPKIQYLPWRSLKKKIKDPKTIGLCRMETPVDQDLRIYGERYNQRGEEGDYVEWVICKFKPKVTIFLANEMKDDAACHKYVLAHEMHHFEDYKSFCKNFGAGLQKAVLKKPRHAPDGLYKGNLKKLWNKMQVMEITKIVDEYGAKFFADMVKDTANRHDTSAEYKKATGLCKSCLKLP